MKKFSKLIILFIILLALILRTYKISSAPPRLTHDEMSIGYNAYSIAKTGKDEWSRILPLSFEAFGDHKLPGYIYATVPFVAVLGMNYFSVKAVSILAGVLTVYLLYLIAKLITNNQSIALISAAVLAISPWPIQISRMGFESNLALAFFSLGLLFLIKSLGSKKIIFSNLWGIFFCLTLYTYVAYRLIIVLLLAYLLSLTIRKKIAWKNFLIGIISLIILLLPLSPQLLNRAGTARFSQVSIFTEDGHDAYLLEQHNFCFLSQPILLPKICNLIFNKAQVLIKNFSSNYLSFIFPTFLFINGDSLEYLSVPGIGEFYWFLSIFYLIGLVTFFKQKSTPKNLLKMAFLIAPIPAALVEKPQIVRGTALLIFICLFTAVGINEVFNKIKTKKTKRLLLIFLLFASIYSFVTYALNYFFIYPGKYESYFYELPPQVAEYLTNNESKYDLIYINDHYPDSHIYLAFFNQIDPNWYQQNVVRPDADLFGFKHPISLGKYQFGKEDPMTFLCDPEKTNTLYVTNFYDKLAATIQYKDFSNVHTQAELYDIADVKQKLIDKDLFESICPAN